MKNFWEELPKGFTVLAPMEGVLSTATHFVLKKYIEHGITLTGEVEDERMLITP